MKAPLSQQSLNFLGSLLLVLSANSGQATEPAQMPLYLSSVPGKPNIMLMVDTSGSMSTTVAANNNSRINIAKTAATNLVTTLTPAAGTLPTVRLGLATYNGDNGGKLLYPLADLDGTRSTAIKAQIATFKAAGVTPLATTLSDIGYYFATNANGNVGNLTLHPGKTNQQSLSMQTIFARSDSRTSGLVGFNPASITQTCTLTTPDPITPASMPTGYVSGCGNYIAGGGSSGSTGATTPVQMLVVSSAPTFCTSTSAPYCNNQQVFHIGSSVANCAACPTPNPGTAETLTIANPSSGAVVAVSGSTAITTIVNPTQASPSLTFGTQTPLYCGTSGTNATGIADGQCRICATLAATAGATTCTPAGCTTNGVQTCANWESPACTKTTDTYYTKSSVDYLIPSGGTCSWSYNGYSNGYYYKVGTSYYSCGTCDCWSSSYCAAGNKYQNTRSKTCSNTGNSCSSASGCYPNSCDYYNTQCSNNLGIGCGSAGVSACYTHSCNNRRCSNNSAQSCSSDSGCYANSCDYYNTQCSNNLSIGCGSAGVSACYTNWCGYYGGHSNRCSNSTSTSCSSNSDCNPGVTCVTGSRCSNNGTQTCSASSDCNSGVTCGVGQCSNNSSLSCSDNSVCNPGVTCFTGSVCSNNNSQSCAAAIDCNPGVTASCDTCNTGSQTTCSCTTSTGTACATAQQDIQIGTGIPGGATGGTNNGGTGGTLGTGALCFSDSLYYTVQYNGSPDTMGPYTGAQLNWYFSQTGFTPGSLELPPGDPVQTCTSDTNTLPIQNYCQKSFAVLVSDGLPNYDRNVGSVLRDYTGDCAAGLCVATSNSLQLPGTSTLLTSSGTSCNKTGGANHTVCQNGTKAGRAYETGGSDYLDDVANALFDMDLRPDLRQPSVEPANAKNNIITYAIGFADPLLNSSSVLSDAAFKSGGNFYYAADAAALATALNSIMSSISKQVGSSASVATNSTEASSSTLVYQAKFDSNNWFGDLIAFPINVSTSTDYGGLNSQAWDAATLIPVASSRNILTYNPSTKAGTTFLCANLTTAQQSFLSCGTNSNLLNYLRGDKTNEVVNTQRVLNSGETETRSSSGVYRNRTRLDPLTHYALTPDPWVLGDIVNSNPIYVGADDYGYSAMTDYSAFLTASKNRSPMLYVGANDGMLHGFNASTGVETMAYVPNAVYPNLANLASPGYSHHYTVDGSPAVGDAYFNSAWHTVLVGTTGAGAQAVFALDITDPSATNSSKVLWEFSNTQTPNTTDATDFSNNLGYTLPQASIVRMHNGSFVALVANGYYSASNTARLYIVDIADGHIIKALNPVNANESGWTTPNGLSAPFAADMDGDTIADYIYAGDLRGNLWKFDVTSSNSSSWAIANGGKPLYVACDQDMSLPCTASHRQPITAAMNVGVGRSANTYMVYFGTGKYFDAGDASLTNAQQQTFYGILDQNPTTVASRTTSQGQVIPTADPATTRGNLVNQSITSATTQNNDTWRTSASNACANDGWYMNLADTGERIITAPILRGSRVIFVTMEPLASTGDACSTTTGGTGWLMELSALCGSSLPTTLPPWDVNGDGKINDSDLVNGKPPSGFKSRVGIPTLPGIVVIPDGGPDCESPYGCEKKYTTGSTGEVGTNLESRDGGTTNNGRESWRQIR